MLGFGTLYYNGQGGAPDYVKAREWFEKAADKGEANAMFFLGLLYNYGFGVAQDYVNAREWFERPLTRAIRAPCTGSASFTTTVTA
jgi:TPR repeat protein